MKEKRPVGRPHVIPGTPKGERSKETLGVRLRPETADKFRRFCEMVNTAAKYPSNRSDILDRFLNRHMDEEIAEMEREARKR